MIFDNAEIELLRLAAWFKGLPAELPERFSSPVFDPAGIEALKSLRLLYASQERRQYRLTPTGWDFLAGIGFTYPQDAKYISDPVKLRRREQAAKVMFTFYRAGFQIFCDCLEALEQPGVFLAAEAMQRSLRLQNTKVWNGLRLCGIGRFGNCGCLLHFTDERGLYFVNEMNRFRRAATACDRAVSIYAASRYADAAYWLRHEPPAGEKKHKSDWVSFRQAARMTQLPLHLLECSDAGALQLLLMQAPNYRKRAARLILAEGYRPAHPALPDTDALLPDTGKGPRPLVAAMDMDLKRLERAIEAAASLGCGQLAVAAFPEQLEALVGLFGQEGNVVFYQVEKEEVARALRLSLYAPERSPFLDGKGGYVHVSQIPQRKRSGRPPAPKLEP